VHPRVDYLDSYYDSLVKLDDSNETHDALDKLLSVATLESEDPPPLHGMDMRVVRTEPGNPPLRLFYFIEKGTVNIVHVETYDELEP